MPSDRDLLIAQEKRISASFLKHSPKERSMDGEEVQTIQTFLETVGGVHEIVTSRLYRCEANSLESYFNQRWGISRAQVYRYMDCYQVLNQLKGFHELPARERLCRSLKKCAKNEDDMKTLWGRALFLAGDDRPIPTPLIYDAWNSIKKERKNEIIVNARKRSYSETKSHSPKRLRTSSQTSEIFTPRRLRNSSQTSDSQLLGRHLSIEDLINQFEEEIQEDIVAEGVTREPESYEPTEYLEYLAETSKDHTVDELVKSLFSTMDALSEMGYKLQPKVGQDWCPIPIKQWRMVPLDMDMSIEVPSLIQSSSSYLVHEESE